LYPPKIVKVLVIDNPFDDIVPREVAPSPAATAAAAAAAKPKVSNPPPQDGDEGVRSGSPYIAKVWRSGC